MAPTVCTPLAVGEKSPPGVAPELAVVKRVQPRGIAGLGRSTRAAGPGRSRFAPVGQHFVQFDGLVADRGLNDVHGQRDALDRGPGGNASGDVEGQQTAPDQVAVVVLPDIDVAGSVAQSARRVLNQRVVLDGSERQRAQHGIVVGDRPDPLTVGDGHRAPGRNDVGQVHGERLVELGLPIAGYARRSKSSFRRRYH